MPHVNNHIADSQRGFGLTSLAEGEVSEIVSEKPPGFVRYGMSVLLVVFLILGLAGWWIRIPETLRVRGRILHSSLSVAVPAKGLVTDIYVREGQAVKKGMLLGCIDRDASLEEVNRLSEEVDTLLQRVQAGRLSTAAPLLSSGYTALGGLQPGFAEVWYTYSHLRSLEKRRAVGKAAEYGEERESWWPFYKVLFAFKKDLDHWKKTHLLRAPADGVVNYVTPVVQGKAVDAGEPFCLLRLSSAPRTVELLVPPARIAGFKKGQPLAFYLEGTFPIKERKIEGIVHFISALPADSGYTTYVYVKEDQLDGWESVSQGPVGRMVDIEVVMPSVSLLGSFLKKQ